MTMGISTRFGMGIMAGIMASVVMTISIIGVTALGFLSIQWFPWVGSVVGSNGTGASLAEIGIAWFFALGIIAGLIFAFIFKQQSVLKGLGFGAIAWFVVVLYMVFNTAPQLSGNLASLSVSTSIGLLVPLAVCFGLWGLAMGYVGKKYV